MRNLVDEHERNLAIKHVKLAVNHEKFGWRAREIRQPGTRNLAGEHKVFTAAKLTKIRENDNIQQQSHGLSSSTV